MLCKKKRKKEKKINGFLSQKGRLMMRLHYGVKGDVS